MPRHGRAFGALWCCLQTSALATVRGCGRAARYARASKPNRINWGLDGGKRGPGRGRSTHQPGVGPSARALLANFLRQASAKSRQELPTSSSQGDTHCDLGRSIPWRDSSPRLPPPMALRASTSVVERLLKLRPANEQADRAQNICTPLTARHKNSCGLATPSGHDVFFGGLPSAPIPSEPWQHSARYNICAQTNLAESFFEGRPRVWPKRRARALIVRICARTTRT